MKNLIIILFACLLFAACKKSETEPRTETFTSYESNRVVPSGDYFVIQTPEQIARICGGNYPYHCNYYFTVDSFKVTLSGNTLTEQAWFTDRGPGAKVDMAIFTIDPNGDAVPPFIRDTVRATTNGGLRSPLTFTKNISLAAGNHIAAVALRATYNGGDWAHNQVWFSVSRCTICP